MISKTESFIKRLRWKVLFLEKEEKNNKDKNDENDEYDEKENFGFKSSMTPPQDYALTAFENDLYALVRSIEFRSTPNEFQKKLARDVKKINKSPHIFVPADKTTNLYKLPVNSYEKLLQDNITSNYKKTTTSVKNNINSEAKEIAIKLKLDDRIERLAGKDAFVTLKDHKDNFDNNPKCRLLNPAKSEIGIISQHYLAKINDTIRSETQVRQWRNTSSVITWFENIESKNNSKFTQFDIVEFYPSISQSLLMNSLNFARTITDIDDDVINTILHSRKSLLFNNDDVWMKKSGNLFDVTMGSFDGAEVCDIVGLYLLNEMKGEFDNTNIGLYRDDGLACLLNPSGPESERFKKRLIKFFQSHGLKITVDTNLHQANFLDVTLDLRSGKYRPYRKPNNSPLYIHSSSNHPPSIIKQLPSMIGKRLSDISCDVEEFNKAKPEYEEALRKSKFPAQIEFVKKVVPKRKRQRNIIWFNPPYNAHTITNVGKEFLKLVDNHFPPHHKYRKIFNRNTIKISYSCTPNMKSIISKHNKKILKHPDAAESAGCNCQKKEQCPLDGNCRVSSIVYKGSVTVDNNVQHYLGSTEPEFKVRMRNHNSAFKHRRKKADSELSKYIWKVKDEGKTYNIKWSVFRHASAYQGGARTCDLCLSEKLAILQAEQDTSLNKRSELMSVCRHRNKFILRNFVT